MLRCLITASFVLLATATVAQGDVRVFRTHYCLYQHDDCRDEPIEIDRDAVDTIAAQLLGQSKNFMGFTDSHGTVLQFYVDGPGKIWVEIPAPKERGSYGTHIGREQFLEIIEQLAEPYAEYQTELGLKFEKW